MTFYAYAWIGTLVSGLIVVLSKYTSKYSVSNPWLLNFIWTLFSALVIIPPALYMGAGLPKDWGSIIITGLFAALWFTGYVIAISKLDVTVVAPLFNFRAIFAVVLGMLFLKESLSPMQMGLIVTAIVAGVCATFDETISIKSFFTPAIGIGLATMAFLALNNLTTSYAVAENGVWTTGLWVSVVSLLFVSLTFPFFRKDVHALRKSQLAPIGVIAVLGLISNISITYALGENVGITSVILSLPIAMILTLILGLFYPKLLESHSKKVYMIRFVSAVVMIVATLNI